MARPLLYEVRRRYTARTEFWRSRAVSCGARFGFATGSPSCVEFTHRLR